MENTYDERKIESAIEMLERGLMIIEKQKEKARSLEIDTHRVSADDDLEDVLYILESTLADGDIDPDAVREDILSRMKEIHIGLKSEMAVLRSLRLVLKII